jgi:hypothetical protein
MSTTKPEKSPEQEMESHLRRFGLCLGAGFGGGAAMGVSFDLLPVGALVGLAAGFGVAVLLDRRAHPSGH